MEVTNKVCSRCKVEKDLSGFCINKSGKYGVSAYCRSCCAERYRRDSSKIKEAVKKYRQLNKEKKRETDKKYRANNRERVKSYQRKYVLNNPEKIRLLTTKQQRRKREELYSSYVRNKILQHTPADLRPAMRELLNDHPELIELKRLEIKTKRLLKKQTP